MFLNLDGELCDEDISILGDDIIKIDFSLDDDEHFDYIFEVFGWESKKDLSGLHYAILFSAIDGMYGKNERCFIAKLLRLLLKTNEQKR